MASTVPYVPNTTWADGSGGGTPVTAAKLNTVEQGVKDAHLMPAVRASHNADQSISNATTTTLAFNAESFDQIGGASAAHHDNSSNNSRLTCLYAGVYLITATVTWATNATGYRQVSVRLNGTTVIGENLLPSVSANNACVQNVTVPLYALAVNDYVEIRVTQSSGGALNVVGSGSGVIGFSMVRVA